MHFFKNCKNDPIITCDMSFERFFSWGKQHNNDFCKILKISLFRDQKPFLLCLQFFPFFAVLQCKGQFSLFFIFDKNSESYISRPFNRHITSKNLKIFRVWPRTSYNSSKKVCFSFLGHFRWKIFYQTLLNLHEILYSIITYLLKSIIY